MVIYSFMLFLYLYQMKTFNNDLDDEEMKISLDVMCELHYKNS